jgi:hypothetical protein
MYCSSIPIIKRLININIIMNIIINLHSSQSHILSQATVAAADSMLVPVEPSRAFLYTLMKVLTDLTGGEII